VPKFRYRDISSTKEDVVWWKGDVAMVANKFWKPVMRFRKGEGPWLVPRWTRFPTKVIRHHVRYGILIGVSLVEIAKKVEKSHML
jgi:hypothetical protein